MRNFVNFIVDNAILFFILTVVLGGVAVFLLKNLNVEAFPDPSPPVIEIVTLYPGRSAEEVEKQITVPLEISLAGMRGLKRINSISLYGLSDIKCQFSYDVSYREARQEVINRLAVVNLPEGVSPRIIPTPIGEVMRYALIGNRNLMELRTLQDWVVSRYLKTAEGVEDVPSYGGFIKAYTVEVDPDKLIEYRVSLSDIIDAISKSNINAGGRPVDFGSQYFMIRGIGLIKDTKDIENIIVAYRDGVPVLVKNLADVKIGNVPRTGIVGLNNYDDIVMGVIVLRRDAKSIPSIRAIKEKIKELNSTILPKDVKIIPIYERAKLIDTVIHKVSEVALIGITLVFVSVLIFLGNFSGAFFASLLVPLSLVMALATMSVMGKSANFLSIAAIDFGIIADIPLFFIESYFRNTEKFGVGRRALLRASEEVGRPIMFSILIIFISFLPVFLMQGAEKRIFSPMVETYVYAISFAIILTFTFLIAALTLFVRTSHKENFIIRTLEKSYMFMLEFLLKLKRALYFVILLFIVIITFVLIKSLGLEFIPRMDEGNIYMRIIFPYSISLSQTYENAKKIRDLLLKNFPEIKTVQFQVGRPEEGTDPTGPFNSEFFIELKPYSQWKNFKNKSELEKAIRKEIQNIFPKADINISQYIQDNLEEVMTGVKGANAVKIFGDDLEILDKIATQFEERLKKIDGISDVGVFRAIGQPNIIIEADRKKLATYGLEVDDVMDIVSAALGGKEATEVIEGDKRFSVLVSLPEEFRNNPENILRIPLILKDGSYVPLSKVANVYFSTGASFIYRENYRRYIPIKFRVISEDLAGTVRKAQEITSDIELPEGYYVEWSGEFKNLVEALQRLLVSGSIAFAGLIAFLYIINLSVINTLISALGILFSFFGGSLSLFITGHPLSLSAIVGFVSIIGINILNITFLINSYKYYYRLGNSETESIRNAVKDRFRAILLSTFTASMGLLPTSLATGVGSQIQKPLAIVVVGGMLISGILILIIVPPLLKYVQVRD